MPLALGEFLESVTRVPNAFFVAVLKLLAFAPIWLSIMGVAVAFCWSKYSPKTAATAAISLGILFTFVGVSAGLADFDPTNLDSSVNQLIDGLKTAFYSSILGMSIAIGIRIFADGKQDRDDNASQKEWIDKLNQAFEHLERSARTNAHVLDQATRSANGLDKLVSQQDAFSDRIKAQQQEASAGLMSAVERTASQIEGAIQAQLGASFQAFNTSVSGLGSWMDEYRSQLQSDKTIRTEIAGYVENVSTALATMTPALQTYGDTVRQMSASIGTLEQSSTATFTVIEKLDGMLTSVADASEALATSNERWLGIASDAGTMQAAIAGFLGTASDAFTENARHVQTIHVDHRDAIETLTQETTTAISALHETFARTMQHVADANDNQVAAFHDAVEKTLATYLDSLSGTIEPILLTLRETSDSFDIGVLQENAHKIMEAVGKETNAMLRQQFASIETSLLEQQQNVATGLATALNAVTGRVADDYGEFMESIQAFNGQVERQLRDSQRILSSATRPLTPPPR